ncbi:MAG TPA: hypothetical protein VFM29_07600, partial [Vicinamibacteria bacterium]|nr:hypothetical protein [Vicinamibacteria bacterium]
MNETRRAFLHAAGVAAVGAAVPSPAFSAGDGAPAVLYPPEDLASFDTPITPRPFALRLGYAAITWEGKDEQAIEDIAAVGFKGIQLRSGVLEKYGDRPAELKRLLDEKGLALLCFSS